MTHQWKGPSGRVWELDHVYTPFSIARLGSDLEKAGLGDSIRSDLFFQEGALGWLPPDNVSPKKASPKPIPFSEARKLDIVWFEFPEDCDPHPGMTEDYLERESGEPWTFGPLSILREIDRLGGKLYARDPEREDD